MCFTIHEKYPKPFKAKEDIVCRKILRKEKGCLMAPYMYNIYEMGKIKKSKLGKVNDDTIEEGLHSFSTLIAANTYKSIMTEAYVMIIKKAIIPKGSYYYFNNCDGQYISTRLIVGKLKKI